MTRKISEEIRFYEKVKPFSKIKEGVFGYGSGINDEHLININLNVTHQKFSYKDQFEWDIVNEENM
jgi:hypothetical protein